MNAETTRRSRASSTALSASLVVALLVGQARVSLGQGLPPAPPAASAGLTAEQKTEAADHFRKGVSLFGEQNYDAAIVEFDRAYRITGDYKLLYNVAVAYRDKGDKASALRVFQTYLKDGGTGVDAKRRAYVEGEITKLSDFVGAATITSNVAGAEVTIDDNLVGRTPLPGPIPVNIGRHRFVATKDGYESASMAVNFASSDKLDVNLKLQEVKVAPPPPPPRPVTVAPPPPPPTATVAPPPPVPQDTGSAQRGLGIGVMIFGVVGLGVGGTLTLVANSKWKDAKAACPGDVCPSDSTQNSAQNALQIANYATVGTVVGAAALVGGLLVLLTAPSAPSAPVATTSRWFNLTPTARPGGGGVLYHGTF